MVEIRQPATGSLSLFRDLIAVLRDHVEEQRKQTAILEQIARVQELDREDWAFDGSKGLETGTEESEEEEEAEEADGNRKAEKEDKGEKEKRERKMGTRTGRRTGTGTETGMGMETGKQVEAETGKRAGKHYSSGTEVE